MAVLTKAKYDERIVKRLQIHNGSIAQAQTDLALGHEAYDPDVVRLLMLDYIDRVTANMAKLSGRPKGVARCRAKFTEDVAALQGHPEWWTLPVAGYVVPAQIFRQLVDTVKRP